MLKYPADRYSRQYREKNECFSAETSDRCSRFYKINNKSIHDEFHLDFLIIYFTSVTFSVLNMEEEDGSLAGCRSTDLNGDVRAVGGGQ